MRPHRFPALAALVPGAVGRWLQRAIHRAYQRWQQLFGFDFFISYSRREASEYAMALDQALAQAGFKCFLDREEFSPGDDLRAATEAHLDNSSALILVATPLALESTHVQREFEYFLSLRRPVIPLSIGQSVERAPPDGAIAKALKDLIWIPEAATQLPRGPSDSAVRALLQAVAIGRRSTKRLRVFAALSVFFFCLTLLSAFLAVAERHARTLAESRSRIATSQRLASEARIELQLSPGRSLALAVESVQVTRSAGEPTLAVAEEALREVLAATGGVQAASHAGPINAIAVSPDGAFVASAGDDRVVRISDVRAPGSTPHEIRVHGDAVETVAFSKDGRWLASGSKDHAVMLLDRLDRTAGAAQRLLRCHTAAISKLAISDDSRWLASASFSDGTVCVWDLAAPARLAAPFRIAVHKSATSSSTPTMAFSPDSQWLLTAFRHDPVAQLWSTDASAGGLRGMALPGHSEGLVSAAFAPDSRSIVTADVQGSLRRWSVPRGRSKQPGAAHVLARDTGAGEQLRISPDGKWLAAEAANRTVSLWRRGPDGTLSFVSSLVGHDGNFVADIEFSEDGRYLATVGGMNILLWDLADAARGMTARVLRGHDRTVNDLLFLPNSRLLASAGKDAHVRLWGLDDEPVFLPDHEHLSNSYYLDFDAVFSEDGRSVATSSRTLQATRVWDLQARAPGLAPRVLEAGPHVASRLSFSADGRRLVASDAQDYTATDQPGRLWVWPLGEAQGRPAVPLVLDTGLPLSNIGVSRTGELIAAGADDAVWLWRVTEQEFAAAGKLRAPKAKALAFDPLGTRLMTGSASGEVRLWDVDASGHAQSGLLLGQLERDVLSVGFSADGRWLAAAGFAHEAAMWRQQPDGSFRQFALAGHGDWISSLAFGDGADLVTGSADGTARLWHVDGGDGSVRSVELRGHSRLIQDVAVRGNLVVTGSMDRTARLWRQDIHGHVTSVLLPAHQGYVRRVRISKDGSRLLTASFDGVVRVWRTRVEDLLVVADRRAVRNLCQTEWIRYMGEMGPHRPTFPRLSAEGPRGAETAVCGVGGRAGALAITGVLSGTPGIK